MMFSRAYFLMDVVVKDIPYAISVSLIENKSIPKPGRIPLKASQNTENQDIKYLLNFLYLFSFL